MFVSLNVWGAYIFFALVCGLGLLLLGLWAPETKGVPMDRMGELFSGPWWMGWKAKIGPEPIEEYGLEDDDVGEQKSFSSYYVERA